MWETVLEWQAVAKSVDAVKTSVLKTKSRNAERENLKGFYILANIVNNEQDEESCDASRAKDRQTLSCSGSPTCT